MKLTHFSGVESTISMATLKDEQPAERDNFKPKGLWLSCDGEQDWEQWCKGERFRLDHYTRKQEVTLQSNSLCSLFDIKRRPILHLYSRICLAEFTDRFGHDLLPGMRTKQIDWTTVAQLYDGIAISPYVWSARTDLLWYYPWDCASACLWRPTKLIASISEPVAVDWTRDLLERTDDD